MQINPKITFLLISLVVNFVAAMSPVEKLDDTVGSNDITPISAELLATIPPVERLFRAALDGDIATLRAELAIGTDVNTRDEYGFTPLMFALMKKPEKRLEKVQLLLAAGADLNLYGNNGRTSALTIAVRKKDIAMIKFLIKAGATIPPDNLRSKLGTKYNELIQQALAEIAAE